MPIRVIMTGELLEIIFQLLAEELLSCRRMWSVVHGRLRCSADLLSKLLNRVLLNPICRILLLCTRKLLILFACLALYTLCAFSCGNFFRFFLGREVSFNLDSIKLYVRCQKCLTELSPYRSGPFPTPKSNGISNLELAELSFTPK